MSNPFLGFEQPLPPARLMRAIIGEADGFASRLEATCSEDPEVQSFYYSRIVCGRGFGPAAKGMPEASEYQSCLRGCASALMQQFLAGGLGGYAISEERFFEQSLAVALWGEALACRTEADAGAAFAVGMLYRIGMVPLARMFGRVKPNLSIPVDCFARQLAYEREEGRSDCLRVGSDLLRSWGFPDTIARTIQYQRHPMLVVGNRKTAVRLAIAIRLGEAMPDGRLRITLETMPETLLDELRAPGSLLQELVSLVEERWQRVSEFSRLALARS